MDTEDRTSTFVSVLRANGISGDGCDERALQEVERQLVVNLPPAYRAFLLIAGHGFPAWAGSHHAVDDDLPHMQQWGRRLMSNRGAKLPDDAFVFFVNQGAAVEFFLLSDGDDPPVYQWVDFASPQPVKRVGQSFTARVSESKRHLDEWLARRSGGA